MKKNFVIITAALFIASCGGGSDKKETDTGMGKEEKKETPAKDLSQNPDYQEGLAIVSKPENLCLTCHKIEEKLTGPAYREVANKYDKTEENITMLAKKVKNGGSGVWGEVPMPANNVISEEDAVKAVKYILLLRNK
jgi:cytochrome c